jgi:hypothetical protein
MMRLLPGENLERFNRISLWIYVDSPAIANNFMELSIHNQGKHIMPLPGRFEGTHTLEIPHGEWQHIVWEFPYVYRDFVTGIFSGNPCTPHSSACAAGHNGLCG